MRRPLAWLGAATFVVLGLVTARAEAQAGQVLKPYVLLMVDTSGSMDSATTSGPASCAGAGNSRLDHAKCAIYNIANSYGDMVLGLGRFRSTTTDTNCANGCSASAIDCSACDPGNGSGCTATMSNDARGEILVGLVDGNGGDLARWNDFSCGTCGNAITSNPELYSAGWTPVAGTLRSAQRYFQGLQATNGTELWPSGAPGFAPIANDPYKDVFLPSGAQCRPYIVIMLTDGDETCTTFANTTAAATALLTTNVGGQTYRIETKPIGFGQTPGDAQIEGLAHAGGAVNVPGVNEGAYAQNEEELQLAISQIIADAIRFESCNDLDDDCDTLVDEDFPNKGMVCDDGGLGICRGTGVRVCNAAGNGTECQITNPGQPATTEVCNNLDDDCDGSIDEGACVGCGDVELCNGLDDDCDMLVDEGLVRDCGTDVGECVRGTETCELGAWVGCTAVGGSAETCDGLDNDCDGVVDGFSRSCSNLPGGNPNTGPCQPGIQVCPPGGSGTWGACVGEIGPTDETCDTIDNDCDVLVDEDTGGADCSSSCGVGQTVCVNGVLECEGSVGGGPEVCNNFDDDCDGVVDNGVPDMGPCNLAPDGTPLCMPGVLRCVGGAYVCQGGTPSEPERCDCDDNDCDGQTDEEPPALCPSGQTCTQCQCAPPCAGGEFPCPAGRTCSQGFCIVDVCYEVTCPTLPGGDLQVCQPGGGCTGEGCCVRACDGVTCPSGQVCVGALGECRPDDCTTFPEYCTAGQQCVGGVCESDPCDGVSCTGAAEYCTGGACVTSCGAVDCPAGQRCELGQCVADPCDGPCPPGYLCDDDDGVCVRDPCTGRVCPAGQACNPDTQQCERDPCLGVVCPGAGEVCTRGTCDVPPVPAPDAGRRDEYVTAGGGGGCQAGGGGGAAAAALVALLLAGAGVGGRPRRRARARGATRPRREVA